MRNLRRNFWPWLRRASGFGWACTGIGIALMLGWATSNGTEEGVQRAGLTLQLASILVLAWRLGELQKHFDNRPWWRKIVPWVRDFPIGIPEGITVEQDAPATLQMKGFDATIRTGVPEEMKKRVERLEREVDKLWDSLDKTKEDLKNQIAELKTEMEEHKETRRQQVARLKDTIERISIDDLKWEGVALSWLFVGPWMTATPELFTRLIGKLF